MQSDPKSDKRHLRRCLELAAKGAGAVTPNPMVGAVLVKNGKVIGEGYHHKSGFPHAEVNAISCAKGVTQGATLYCNLEPCCHTKKQTPPCVPLIIDKGISRVVICNSDPNPAVNGEGIKKMRTAGITVNEGLLKKEGKELNKFYFKYISSKIPYVTLKVAQSADGLISEGKNKQTWLTGNESNRFVHQQRSAYDAVFVGANTIAVDNSQLTVRNVDGRNPKRIILDGNLNIDLHSKILTDTNILDTWILTSNNSDKEKINLISEKGARVIQFDTGKNGIIDIKDILSKLGEYKITSLFIEGGRNIFSQFIEGNYFDEIIILQAPINLGKGLEGLSVSSLNLLKKVSTEKLGDDLKIVYKKN